MLEIIVVDRRLERVRTRFRDWPAALRADLWHGTPGDGVESQAANTSMQLPGALLPIIRPQIGRDGNLTAGSSIISTHVARWFCFAGRATETGQPSLGKPVGTEGWLLSMAGPMPSTFKAIRELGEGDREQIGSTVLGGDAYNFWSMSFSSFPVRTTRPRSCMDVFE